MQQLEGTMQQSEATMQQSEAETMMPHENWVEDKMKLLERRKSALSERAKLERSIAAEYGLQHSVRNLDKPKSGQRRVSMAKVDYKQLAETGQTAKEQVVAEDSRPLRTGLEC